MFERDVGDKSCQPVSSQDGLHKSIHLGSRAQDNEIDYLSGFFNLARRDTIASICALDLSKTRRERRPSVTGIRNLGRAEFAD